MTIGPLDDPRLRTLGDLGGGEGLRETATPSLDNRLFVVRMGGGRLFRTTLFPLLLWSDDAGADGDGGCGTQLANGGLGGLLSGTGGLGAKFGLP